MTARPLMPPRTTVGDLARALTRIDPVLAHGEPVHRGDRRRQTVGEHLHHERHHLLQHERGHVLQGEPDDVHAQEQPALLLLEGTGFVPVRLNILITGIRSGTSSRAFAA